MKVYKLHEVAEILQITEKTVRDYIDQGKLKTVKGMGVLRISQKELQRFIEGE